MTTVDVYEQPMVVTIVDDETIVVEVAAVIQGGGGSGGAVSSVNGQTGDVVLVIPDQLSDLADDATHRTVTDAEKTTWSGKQAALGFTPVPNTRTVAGKALSADVTLAKGDVGLGNVDNTSDANKPVSTAQQAALDLKANDAALAAVAKTGDYADLSNKPTIPTVPASGVGTATLNFGASPGLNYATVTVTSQAAIGASNVPLADIPAGAQGSYSAEEVALLSCLIEITCSAPTAGQGFTIAGYSTEKIEGSITVAWRW